MQNNKHKYQKELPLYKNRKQRRAVSIEELIEKTIKQNEQFENDNEDVNLIKKLSIKNLNFNGKEESQKESLKYRSSSLTQRTQLTQITDEKKHNNNKLSIQKMQDNNSVNKQINLKVTKKLLELKQLNQYKPQSGQKQYQKILQMEGKFSTIMRSNQNLLNSKRGSFQNLHQFKQTQGCLTDRTLTLFQFANNLGFKLPQFIQ